MSFNLLDRRNKLMISAPTSSTTNGISRNIVHTTLGINN